MKGRNWKPQYDVLSYLYRRERVRMRKARAARYKGTRWMVAYRMYLRLENPEERWMV